MYDDWLTDFTKRYEHMRKPYSNPQEAQVFTTDEEIEKVEVVKPEVLARWREWGVPEEIIVRAIRQKQAVKEARRVEEWLSIPNFPYMMPRLPKIEANPWGFAKIIDTEGTILPHTRLAHDKVRRINRWLYRWEYYQPVIAVRTRNYNLTEEIANIQNVSVTILREWDIRMRRYALSYHCRSTGVRAIRICLLTVAHLVVPNKKARARKILTEYRERPAIPIPLSAPA